MKRLFLLCCVFLAASAVSNLHAGGCRVAPIVAADTGNIIGYVCKGDKGTIIVQNAGSVGAACQRLKETPAQQT